MEYNKKNFKLNNMKGLREYAEKQEMILDDIYLSDDLNEEHPQTIYAENRPQGLIFSVCSVTGVVQTMELIGNQEEISIKHRDEILKNRLAVFTDEDKVSLGDIFMTDKFMRNIEVYKIENIGELVPLCEKFAYWSLNEILEEINRDHSEEFTPYTEKDWREGWKEWCEGLYYKLLN